MGCNECCPNAQSSQLTKSFIFLQKESFCPTTVVVLLSNCSPFALQKWSICSAKKPRINKNMNY